MSRNLEQEAAFVSLVQFGVGRERSFHGWWGVSWRRNVEGLVDENEGWTTGIEYMQEYMKILDEISSI